MILSRCILLLGMAAVTARAQPSGLLTLDQAIREALDHNLSLLAERYNVSVADAARITARLRPNPVLSVGGDHLDALGAGFSAANNGGPNEVSLRTDFVFERGGKRHSRMEVAENARGAAEMQVRNVTRSILLDVQGAFVDVLLAKENLALAQGNLKSFEGVVAVNEARVRSGDLAQVELLRTRVGTLQFRNAVRQAELKLRTAKNRLQLLLGRTAPSPSFDVTGEMRRDAAPANLESLRDLARQRRPDLQALHRQQARSVADLRLQIAQSKVDYTVGTEYRRQQGISGTANTLGFFFSAPLPVFNRNQGEIERVHQEQRQIEARIHELEAAIAVELENAYQQLRTSGTLVETFEKDMLQQARDVRRITEYSYRRGEATFVEFLDAQRAFNDTVQGYNEARAEYARGLFLLDAVTGQEWKP